MQIYKGGFINDFIDRNLQQYSIPVYQRNYEWSAEQCEKLFEDILQAYDLDLEENFVYSARSYQKTEET